MGAHNESTTRGGQAVQNFPFFSEIPVDRGLAVTTMVADAELVRNPL